MTLIDDYIKEQERYSRKYGPNTIVLMQVGHFFECYGVDNKIEKSNCDNLYKLSDILNIQLTRKNKNIVENSRKNPLMIGINIYSTDKYVQLLLNNNYTTVLIEQVNDPPYVERKVTGIYSPGTNIEYSLKGDTNNLMSIYLERTKNDNLCIGISIIDLSTGKNMVYELYSNKQDKSYGIDEIFRTIQSYDPKEILFIKKNICESDDFFINNLDLNQRVVHFKNISEINSEYQNINYQKTFLGKIFKNTGILSVIEYIDLENKPFALLSYIIILDFAYEHNASIIDKIDKPNIWDNDKYLNLTNNSINQLNLVAHKNIPGKYDSLFSVINNTSTHIGKRMLRDRLLNPIINVETLNFRYNCVESMMSNRDSEYYYKCYEENLNKIQDLERLHRKMALSLIQPSDFSVLDFSYEHVNNILAIKNDMLNKLRPSDDTIAKFKEFIEEYRHDFNMDAIIKYHLDKIQNSFFNKQIYPEIDELQCRIENCYKIFNIVIKNLSKHIEEKKQSKYQLLKLENNDRDGYFITLTGKRNELLKKKLKKENYPNIVINFSNKTIEIETRDISSKCVSKPNVRLVSEYLKELSNKLITYQNKIHCLCRDKFLEKMEYYDSKYSSTLKIITEFVAEIDVIKSIAKTSTMYAYTKPRIEEADNSFIIAKSLRHPIIERINDSYNYVPNDVSIGKNDSEETNGILLFGTNASGKSSLMKGIGLNIILAQAGFFVACKEFRFNPYKYLFTRINNNDNIFKGESSFAVEMGELRSILKRSDSRSLVLGDELCSGTENISALAIFSSSVIKLCERKTNFVFATHLHDLCKIPQIMELDSIKMFHLKVIFNKETGELVYDRKLEEGNGPTIYGLEVCRAMDMDNDFLMLSEKIRKQIVGEKESILSATKSHYNSKVFLDKCGICGVDAEDAHHIKFQSSADEMGIIDSHIVKNTKYNLVPLCKKCHDNVHHGNLEINSYKLTSNGVKLDHSVKEENPDEQVKKNKKLTDEQVEIIRSLKQSNSKLKSKTALAFLEKNHSIKISSSTYSKIINNRY